MDACSIACMADANRFSMIRNVRNHFCKIYQQVHGYLMEYFFPVIDFFSESKWVMENKEKKINCCGVLC